MNSLINKNYSILSVEVAEMVGKEHSKLMRDVRRYSSQLNEAKIGFVDFWEEATYMDSKGENRPCYLITKKGCEFIAHKLTGPKGTEFTARYINRFHEMEEEIKQQAPKLPTVANNATVRIAPRRSTWYMDNSSRLNRICKKRHMQLRELYSEILTRLSKVYDIQACRVIYERENGYPPTYAIDIIPFFKELEIEVDKYLQDMDLRLSRDPLSENPFK